MIEARRRFGWLDVLLLGLVALLAAYVWYRLAAGLDYRWRWNLVGQYLLREQDGRLAPGLLLKGLGLTLRLSLWAGGLAVLLGALGALQRLSPRPLWRMLGTAYVELIRNLPPLVLVFIVYYFVADQLLALIGFETWLAGLAPATVAIIEHFSAPRGQLGNFLAAVLALSLYEGAYMTEIIRAGIEAVDRGQWEASRALGFSRYQQLRHVIWPQAVKHVLPPLSGQLVSTIKDSAIVSVISLAELSFQGLELMAATYLTFEIWLVIAGLYFGLTFTCALMIRLWEKRLRRRA